MENLKDREISKVEFFQLLQKEYITAEVRRKIYYKKSDKTYWGKICEFKKKRIISLSKELMLTNLFDNEESRFELLLKFRNEGGRPLFHYKPNGDDKSLENTDLLNYYSTGSDIKEVVSGKLGKIIKTSDDQILQLGEVIVEIEGVKKISKLEEITRVI